MVANKATIEGSRKAIEQSGRPKKLDLLAMTFIPPRFYSSLSSLIGLNTDLRYGPSMAQTRAETFVMVGIRLYNLVDEIMKVQYVYYRLRATVNERDFDTANVARKMVEHLTCSGHNEDVM
ncbi:hypothetical protein PENCOP_c001G06387 [Penicillium coprophilum]|uniref:Uncharacterized protein n=1 Tax=Penicillium coprophilum TaxID=36646 RepID=A0A1V6V5Z9_9EURO|nr:hypothetical protein PENCOP_c001G06387 [Penicillium coprophilum]